MRPLEPATLLGETLCAPVRAPGCTVLRVAGRKGILCAGGIAGSTKQRSNASSTFRVVKQD